MFLALLFITSLKITIMEKLIALPVLLWWFQLNTVYAQISVQEKLYLYTDPTTNDVYVLSNADYAGRVTVHVYTLTGTLLYSVTNYYVDQQVRTMLPKENLQTGSYMIGIEARGTIDWTTLKFSKK